ncbi:hypothetical protein CBS101457_003770 [Exobasidium rhododendri]|nr:hypothetical protein CBS101457_003770 [Exobasidium rhododendri]
MDDKAKISFGFKKAVPGIGGSVKGGAVASSSKVVISKPSFFGDDDDDEVESKGDTFIKESSSKKKKDNGGLKYPKAGQVVGGGGSVPLSRSAKQRTEEALAVDASVFDYDGVYESMKVGERELQAQREVEKKKRDPKYIAASLASSEQRKLDRVRAESKMIQRERDAEGEEFAGTESFVTDAYKKQMVEMQEAEGREKEKEEKDRLKSRGVAAFYRKYMEEDDRAHQAAVTASLRAAEPSTDDATRKREEGQEDEESKDLRKQRAVQEAREKGLNVRVNDDNEVVDERSLLSAGLNTFGKKKKEDEDNDSGKRSDGDRREYRGDKNNAGRDGAREAREAREAQRQRQSKMIEDQMLELEEKKALEAKQEEEERKKTLIVERRNDESSVASARMRALERKRKREAEELEERRKLQSVDKQD